MGWFEDQIDARKKCDRDALNEAYESAINAVVGESFSFDEAEDVLTIILKYYGLENVKIPEHVKDDNEKLSMVCRLSGLMQRPVRLESDWYKNAFGAFLCKRKDNGGYVAALPNKLGKYYFFDKDLHKRVVIGKKTSALLDVNAICFYKPLPAKKMSVIDLVKFGISAWSITDYVLTFAMLIITTIIGLITPNVSYFLYSNVVEEGKISLLLSTVFFMISLGVTTVLLNAMKTLFNNRTTVKMCTALQSGTMMRVLSLSPNFFNRYSTGDLISRMSYVETVCVTIVDTLFSTLLSSLFSLAYITQIVKYAKSLVIPSLIVILANVLFSLYTTLRQMKLSKMQMEAKAKNQGLCIELISGIQKIKMSGAEKRMFAKYAKSISEEAKLTYNPPFFHKYNGVISTAIVLAGQLIISYFTIKSDVTVAEYYAFQTSFGMISAAISGLASVAIQIAGLKPSLEMMQPILDEVPENRTNVHEVGKLCGNIELNNVSFRYDENMPNIIDDFSLKIKSGEYVAIVGKTGCGKSTLVKLLLGFEKPQKGAIYYDGKDLNQIEKRSLRKKIGTVMQDDKLFTGDIYSNITICAPTLTLDEAWEAAEIAGIADDIREMPMGMSTFIQEAGAAGMSGGQRQRLVIARAIAPRPSILIFDEATSALDNVTQKQVSESLDSLKCTRIVIAHRLSTIKHCDRILVMDKGKIIEDGKYDELVAKNGFFSELVARQRLDAKEN